VSVYVIGPSPAGLDMDDNDNLYIADPPSHNIQMFSGDGGFFYKVGGRGQ